MGILRRLIAALSLALIFLPGSADAADAPIKIAAVYNKSGSQAGLDLPSLKGARLAVEAVNREGGLLGRRIELLEVDGASDPAKLALAVKAAIAQVPGPSAFFGLSDTDMVLAAAPPAAQRGVVFVTSGATSPQLPEQVPDDLFLACFGDNVQAAAVAEFARENLQVARVAILANKEMSYTRLLQGYFAERFGELGGEVVSRELYSPGEIEDAIARLKQADAVFAAVGPEEVTSAIAKLRAAGFKGPILGGDSFDLGSAWQNSPEVEGVYFSTHAYLGDDTTDARAKAFIAAYEAAYPGEAPDAFSALGYDAAGLVIAAIRRAGSDEPAKVKAALAETSGFEGVTGVVSYSGGRRIPSKTVSIITVTGGRLRLAEALVPAKVPAP